VADGSDWLRIRGMGRERFAGYVADFLTSAGFDVDRSESTEPVESRLTARLVRMNPAVPASLKELTFRVYPTGGGAALAWLAPTVVDPADRSRADRFVREFLAHLERAVLTESHATAKVTRIPDARLPWEARAP
jgi:hypothetical protein